MASTAAARGRAADRGGRVQPPRELERARCRRPQPAADAGGEVGDGAEHRDLGDGAGVELGAALLERFDDRRRRRSGARGGPSPTRPAHAATRRRCRRPSVPATGRDSTLVADRGARAARGWRRRARRTRRRSDPGWLRHEPRARCRAGRTGVSASTSTSRASTTFSSSPVVDRGERALDRGAPLARAMRGADDGEPGGRRSPVDRVRRLAELDLGDPRPTVELAVHACRHDQLARRVRVERQARPPRPRRCPGRPSGSSASTAASPAATSSGASARRDTRRRRGGCSWCSHANPCGVDLRDERRRRGRPRA